MELGSIIHWNVGLDISERRLTICYSCPIYSTRLGGLCNSKLWLNPNTGDISTEPKDGYKRGCGCKISYKVKNVNNKCPLGKW